MGDEEDDITIVDIPILHDSVSCMTLSTSAVLSHCKKKILLPYQRLLAIIGLRALETPVLSEIWPFVVLALLVGGYVLHYMLCFRRDVGFQYTHPLCTDNLLYCHVIPSLLHLAAYLQALLTMRVRETERLEMLMEGTFLLAAHRPDGTKSTKVLVRSLWFCISCSIFWVVTSIVSVCLVLYYKAIFVRWVSPSSLGKLSLEILLVITTLWQDLLQATIVASYCLQVLLLCYTVNLLRSKLLNHTCQPLEWVREVSDFQQSIRYLNEDLAPAVSLLTLLNFTWAGSGVISLVREEREVTGLNSLIVGLWVVIAAAPVAAAAYLTSTCFSLRGLGHEIRARPFVYQSTPARDLDTLLLFSSSLRLRAKLCGFPVSPQYLLLILAIAFIVILTLGQSHLL